MSGYAVTFENLHVASSGLRVPADELAAELRALSSSVDAVLAADWRGSSATSFRRQWEGWHAAARDVLANLAVLADLVTSAASSYEHTESAVRQAAL